MKLPKKSPWAFIILIGVISLFSDMTHEGARSITGPYLALLGASATIVGFVAGFGELTGYAVRLLAGLVADKSGKYWTVTFIGYIINLLAVPALALAGSWQMAAVLMILERMGRAIRNPARDTMLSHATSSVGHGTGFGIHEALDQIGAVAGPLIVSAVYFFSKDYQHSFAVLLIPALIAIAILCVARWVYPDTKGMEIRHVAEEKSHFRQFYWIYLIATSLVAAGFADYPLIAYHFDKTGQVPTEWIPVMYAIAMGVDAIAAIVLGKTFDQLGMKAVIVSTLISILFSPFVFMGNFSTAIIGMVCWGVGMAAQESVMRAVLASILPPEKRATGFGIFNAIFGVCWFAGSFLMGWLYDLSIPWLIAFSVIVQAISLPLFIKLSDMKQAG